jgi:hypothetical protein
MLPGLSSFTYLRVLKPQPPTSTPITNAQLLALRYVSERRVGTALGVEVAGPDDVLVEGRAVEHGAEAEGERLREGAAVVVRGGPVAAMRLGQYEEVCEVRERATGEEAVGVRRCVGWRM